jgi:hypothetical protein
MKPLSFLTSLLPLAALTGAAINNEHAHDAEALASKEIARLQNEYQRYIHATLKTRETGCTSKNILRRREWSASLPFLNFFIPHKYTQLTQTYQL